MLAIPEQYISIWAEIIINDKTFNFVFKIKLNLKVTSGIRGNGLFFHLKSLICITKLNDKMEPVYGDV